MLVLVGVVGLGLLWVGLGEGVLRRDGERFVLDRIRGICRFEVFFIFRGFTFFRVCWF